MIVIAYDLNGDEKEYSITNDYGLFDINDDNGIITLEGALDYETAPEDGYTLTVNVSDGTATTSRDVTVTVGDVNEAPVFTQSNYQASVFENDAAAAVATVSASADAGEEIIYSITSGASGVFEIDRTSGAITLTGPLDFESATEYTLTVNAFDGVYNNSSQVTVNVKDANDNAPVLTANNNKTTASLAEQTAAGSVDTGIAFTVSDVDTVNMSFSESDFSVSDAVSGEIDNRFDVVADGDNWKLQLKAGATLDYETPADQSIALMVKVNDGTHSDEVEITINVTDINDNAPTLTANNNKTTASLAEQTATESVDTGITFTASDVDTNTSFSASDFTVSGDDRFEVVADGNNWKLQLIAGKTLNYETTADQSIALKVKVSDGIHDSKDVDVTISVTDVNDAPVFDPQSPLWFLEDSVVENAAIETQLAVFWAGDEDGDAVTYRIVPGASSSLFSIDADAGDV